MTRDRRFELEARAAAVAERVIERLPRGGALRLGRAFGRLWSDLDRRHVAIASQSLQLSFPHWDEPRVLRTARAVYEHFGAVIFDLLWLSLRPADEVLSVVDVEGREHLLGAAAGETGALMASAHFGNWEIGGLITGRLLGGIGVLARPLDNPALDAKLCALRAITGNTVVYKRRALQQVLRLLSQRKSVAILIDQNVGSGGAFVDFFGRPAATTTVAAALAIKTGAPVLPAFVELLPSGRYRMLYRPPIRPRVSGDRQADVVWLTQQLTSAIEAQVRERPEQWLWLHRRWKTQPSAQPAVGEAPELA